MFDVWKWGPKVGGKLWRASGEIWDNWKSMECIGFRQGQLALFAAPGHWNDPDMREVGNGGRTPAVNQTHCRLWCLRAAPLTAGNGLRTRSAETRDILTNREVIAHDLDPLKGSSVSEGRGAEIWLKPLKKGGFAVGIFNRNGDATHLGFSWSELGLASTPRGVRDLWRHEDAAPTVDGYRGLAPGHGVILLRPE